MRLGGVVTGRTLGDVSRLIPHKDMGQGNPMVGHRITTAIARDDYLTYLQARHAAAETLRNRRITLDQLISIAGDIPLQSVSVTHLDQWRTSHAWQPSTANRKMSEVRAFFGWAHRRGLLQGRPDPTAELRSERVPVRHRLRIPADEWTGLLDCAPHPLERALVACGLYLMARSSELRTIRLRHVSLDTGTVEVFRHKVQRPDVLPICSELDHELRRWLAWYANRFKLEPEMYLLPNRVRSQTLRDGASGRLTAIDPNAQVDPWSPLKRPHRHVQTVLQRAGFAVQYEGGHTLRRSAARAYYDELCAAGYDGALRRVQSMLDHSSSVVTEGYLGLTLDKEARNRALSGKPMFGRAAQPTAAVRHLDSYRSNLR